MPSAKNVRVLAVAAIALWAAAGCSDSLGSNAALELPAAFQTVPVGFSANSSSFDESGDAGDAFLPESFGGTIAGNGQHGSGHGPGVANHRDGFGQGGLRNLLMGGGLGRDFIGALAFGRGLGRGPFGSFLLSDRCSFDAATQRVVCPTRDRHGLSVDVSFSFLDADGLIQEQYDTETTNTVNVRTNVSGTKTRREGDVMSTVAHTSDRTVGGLASGSTERTVNGTAEATEHTTGTRDGTAFTATREAADTTTGLVIPLVEGRPTIPSAGTVIRRMRVEITKAGETTRSRFRREVITFNGTNMIQVQITQDDVTKDCTITLPSRRLECGS